MEYELIYNANVSAFLFGTENNGFGIFYDDLCEDGPGYYGNVSLPNQGIMIGPCLTLEDARKECVEVYEKCLKNL